MDVVPNSCATHFGKIGELNGTHRKYIKNEAFLKDKNDGFGQCIKFISRQTNENFVTVLQDKLIEKLQLMGVGCKVGKRCVPFRIQFKAFGGKFGTEHWSGDLGRYTLAHSKGPGGR